MPGAVRIATANVHVRGVDGHAVALRAGDAIPVELFDRIGSHVYVEAGLDATDVLTGEPISAPSTTYDPDDIASLRGAAKARGLSAGGSKQALAARIAEHDGQ
jgi:hypothetical protein